MQKSHKKQFVKKRISYKIKPSPNKGFAIVGRNCKIQSRTYRIFQLNFSNNTFPEVLGQVVLRFPAHRKSAKRCEMRPKFCIK